MVVREEGMPKYGMPSEYGDLIVTFKVESPDKLTAEQQEAFR